MLHIIQYVIIKNMKHQLKCLIFFSHIIHLILPLQYFSSYVMRSSLLCNQHRQEDTYSQFGIFIY